jgi:hypothetical protein
MPAWYSYSWGIIRHGLLYETGEQTQFTPAWINKSGSAGNVEGTSVSKVHQQTCRLQPLR